MTLKDLKQLGEDLWKGSVLKEENRLIEMLNKYDQEKKGALHLHQFKTFFVEKCRENVDMIWKLLSLSGYKNNLRHKD
jgi:hypothetical protein